MCGQFGFVDADPAHAQAAHPARVGLKDLDLHPGRMFDEFAADRHAAQQVEDQSAQGVDLGAFFRRIPPAAATAALKDLAELLPEAIAPEDYIDLGEHTVFNPEVMEGECAS